MNLTLVLPSYGRRELTERAVRSVFAQEFAGRAELFFLGDGCPIYQEIVTSDWFTAECERVGGWLTVHTMNQAQRDGTPAPNINRAIAAAAGEYFLFMANDDRIAPNHFASYHDFAKANDADLTCTNSTIEIAPATSIRNAQWDYGCVGHSEICVRTSLAQSVPPHHRGYGHDWDFICAVKAAARPERVFKNPNAPTYFVNMGPREHVYQNGTV